MSDAHESPLLPSLEKAGGVIAEYHGRRLVRHFGEPHAEYAAATEGVAVFDRSHRVRLTISGRSPGQMLNGVLTGRLPEEAERGDESSRGQGSYHAVLTPKGKMITDLVALRPGGDEDVGFLLDVPAAGGAGLKAHLAKFLPPRFAAVREASLEIAAITFVGPDAAGVVARLALGLRVDTEELAAAAEYQWWSTDPTGRGLLVMRTHEVWPTALTVYGPAESVATLWRRAVEGGARPGGLGVWSTLRVEAGRPVFGTDMDESTLPPEAGIVERAVDHSKGCYTGQEVIVRIRDRGHVNRHLRLLRLGDVAAPAKGASLLSTDGKEKSVGEVRSVVQSPRFGGVLAMAYVRRGVESFTLEGDELSLSEIEVLESELAG